MAAGKVEIDVTAETGKAKKSLSELGDSARKSIEGKLKGAGTGALDTLGRAGAAAGKAIAGAAVAAGAAVVGIGASALNAYADYEQLVGGVDTLFGSASKQVQAYAAEAYRTAGMSANQYMTQATSFSAALVSGLGGDTAKAAEVANTAMTDMSDNVNKMGSSMTDVQNAYQGFAKQNYTMLDNLKLGYGGTQSEMARLINDSGVLGDTIVDANSVSSVSFDKVIEAIHVTQERMGLTGTTAKEAATTISGSIGMAKAAWENWLVGIADPKADMGALTTQLLDSIGAVAKNVAPRVAEIGRAIIDNLPGALSGVAGILAPILSDALATAWNHAVKALSSIGINLPEIDSGQIMGAFNAIKDTVQSLVDTVGPALGSVFNGLMSAVQAALPYVQPFVDALGNFATAVAPVVAAAVGAIIGALQILLPGLLQIGTIVLNGIAQIISFITLVVTTVVGAVAGVVGAITGIPGFVSEMVTAFLTFLGNLIAGVVSWAGQMASNAMQAGSDFLNNVVTFVTQLPGKIWALLSDIIGKVTTWVSNMASKATQAGSDFIGNVISFITQLPGKVWSFLSDAISKATSFASEMASKAAQAGSDFITRIVDFYSRLPGRVWEFLSDAIGKAASFVGQMATKASEAGRSFLDNIVSVLSGIPSRVVSIGSDIVAGIARGISGAVGQVTGAIRGVVDSAINGAKRLLGIASPSKVFRREVGKWIPLGAAEGIEDESKAVQRAIDATFGLDPTVNVDRAVALSATAPAPAPIQQTIQFNQPVQTPDELARTMRMYGSYGLAGVR